MNRVVDVDGERGLYLRCMGAPDETLVVCPLPESLAPPHPLRKKPTQGSPGQVGIERISEGSGSGSPTLVMEGGDEDTSDTYAFAERRLAAVTRTCVYDRANLGRSGRAHPCRGVAAWLGGRELLNEEGRA